jgi:hypothetical protein
MLKLSRVLDRPSGMDRVLRPMRLFTTPHAGSSGAQLRVSKVGMICAALLMAAAPAAAQPTQAVAPTRSESANRATPDPQQVAMARALFEEGLRHVDAEEWSLAADRFARVLALRYSAVAAYNLALARARLGSSVLALEGLRELLAQPGLEATVRDAALSLQKEQQAYVGWLTVRVHGECANCVVQLDTKPLPPAALGVAVPVDPGHHVLALLRDERVIASTSLSVSKGARVEGNLDAPASLSSSAPIAELSPTSAANVAEPVETGPEPAAPSAALAASSSAKQPKGSLLSNPWFWGGVGVLAVGVVTLGVVLAGSGNQATPPVPGNFSPNVISGEVKP